MSDRRGMFGLAALIWLLASSVTATISHILIGIFGNVGIGGHAYADHAHGAVVPLALTAINAALALLLRSALTAVRRSHRMDRVAIVLRRCGERRPLVPSLVVALGGLTTLLAMEIVEQRSTLGHIERIQDAFGGNALVGLAIVVVAAVVVTVVGLRAVRVVLASTVKVVSALIAFFRFTAGSPDLLALGRTLQRRRDPCVLAFIERCFGMRAPPLPDLG